MNKPSPALWTLIAMQALSMCAPPMVILIGGLIGTQLAPNPQLATLPLSILVITTAFSTFPTAMIMQHLGRKKGFLIGNLVSLASCGIAIVAIYAQSFVLLLVATGGLGFNIAFVNQFRFAAMERVAPEHQGQAVSWLLLGGIFAALVGPELGALGESLLGVPYAGAFLLLAGVLLGSPCCWCLPTGICPTRRLLNSRSVGPGVPCCNSRYSGWPCWPERYPTA